MRMRNNGSKWCFIIVRANNTCFDEYVETMLG